MKTICGITLYESKEELMADIIGGSMGEGIQQVLLQHEEKMALRGQEPSLFVFLDELKQKGLE